VGYRHLALFRLHDTASPADVDRALDALRRLGLDTAEPIEWQVALSLDSRKGTVIVENALFESRESYERWRADAPHRAVAEMMSGIADWLVGDYVEPPTVSGPSRSR